MYVAPSTVPGVMPMRAPVGLAGCTSCGLGLFESGLDFQEWTWQEWAIVSIAAYALSSMVFTTSRAAKSIAAAPARRRKSRAARLRKEASELTKKKGLF